VLGEIYFYADSQFIIIFYGMSEHASVDYQLYTAVYAWCVCFDVKMNETL